MLDTIIELLKRSGADAWELTDTHTERWEFYFIRHQLDQNRTVRTEQLSARVFRKTEDGMLGSASFEIAPTLSEAEMKQLIGSFVENAGGARNQPFELNRPAAESQQPTELPPIEQIARDFIEVMQQLPETAGEDINSYEIFTSLQTARFLNSNGIDVTSVYPASMMEVVVNARKEAHEIELYRMYKSGTCDREGLKREITQVMQYGRDRLEAVCTPVMEPTAVLFSTDACLEIYRYFAEGVNASNVYRGISQMKKGQPIASAFSGDRITLRAVRSLPNSSANSAFDEEGAPVHDLTLIQDGVPVQYWGSEQYRWYLGEKDSFIAGNFAAGGGTATEEQLRSGRYLEIVEFSDFQVSPLNGDIFGEIRLGYLHDGGRTAIVSGGSVSGSMTDFVKEMRMSVALCQYDSWQVPALTRLENVRITGISA
jgi:PmbA protein